MESVQSTIYKETNQSLTHLVLLTYPHPPEKEAKNILKAITLTENIFYD